MKPWRAIAFHTDDDIYNECITNLRDSLHKFNILHSIKTIPKLETWNKTLLSLHPLILEAFDLYKENLVYLDADAIIRQYPILFDTIDCDVAVHYKDDRELLAGTTYLKNCAKTKQLVKEWMANSLKDPRHLAAQTGLDTAIKEGDYNVYRLPAPYTLIFDSMKHQGPPVIEHFQASRRSRRL